MTSPLRRDELDKEAEILFKQVGYSDTGKGKTIQRAGLFLKGLRENYYHLQGSKAITPLKIADPHSTQQEYEITLPATNLIDISFNDGTDITYFDCLTTKYLTPTPTHAVNNDISPEITKYIRFLFTNIENKPAMDIDKIIKMQQSKGTIHPFTYALIHSLFDISTLTFRPRLNIAMCLSLNIQKEVSKLTTWVSRTIPKATHMVKQLVQFMYLVNTTDISKISISTIHTIGNGGSVPHILILLDIDNDSQDKYFKEVSKYIDITTSDKVFDIPEFTKYINGRYADYKTKLYKIVVQSSAGIALTPSSITWATSDGRVSSITSQNDMKYVLNFILDSTNLVLDDVYLKPLHPFCVDFVFSSTYHPLVKSIYLYQAYKNAPLPITTDGVRELARLIPLDKKVYIDEVKLLLTGFATTTASPSEKKVIEGIDIPMLDTAHPDDDVVFTYKDTMQLLLNSMIPSKSTRGEEDWFDNQLDQDIHSSSKIEGRNIFIKDGKEYYKDENEKDVEINARYYGNLVKEASGKLDDNYCPIVGVNNLGTDERCDVLIRGCMLGDSKSLAACKAALLDTNFWDKVKEDLKTIVPKNAQQILDTCKFKRSKDIYETPKEWLSHISATASKEITSDEVNSIKDNKRLMDYLTVLQLIVNNYLKMKTTHNAKDKLEKKDGVVFPFKKHCGGYVSPISSLVSNLHGGSPSSVDDKIHNIITGIWKGTLKCNPVSPLYIRDISTLITDYETASKQTFPSDSKQAIDRTLAKMESYETNLSKLKYGLQQYIMRYKTETATGTGIEPITKIQDIIDMGEKYNKRQEKLSGTEEKLIKLIKALQAAIEAGSMHMLPNMYHAIY